MRIHLLLLMICVLAGNFLSAQNDNQDSLKYQEVGRVLICQQPTKITYSSVKGDFKQFLCILSTFLLSNDNFLNGHLLPFIKYT